MTPDPQAGFATWGYVGRIHLWLIGPGGAWTWTCDTLGGPFETCIGPNRAGVINIGDNVRLDCAATSFATVAAPSQPIGPAGSWGCHVQFPLS